VPRRASLLLTLALTSCAAPRPVPPPTRGACTIAEPRWPNVDDAYDRPATIDALTELEKVVRDAAAVGPAEVANRLDRLFRRPAGVVFVSKWAFDAAVRLRQLACAHQAGQVDAAEVDRRYVAIINDIEDERGVIVDEMRRRAP
jgi:hypothetical protein